jgi:hypothetical protein
MSPFGGPFEMEMLKTSPVPSGPESVTFTVKTQGIPLLVHVPPNVAVLPGITSEVELTLCSLMVEI